MCRCSSYSRYRSVCACLVQRPKPATFLRSSTCCAESPTRCFPGSFVKMAAVSQRLDSHTHALFRIAKHLWPTHTWKCTFFHQGRSPCLLMMAQRTGRIRDIPPKLKRPVRGFYAAYSMSFQIAQARVYASEVRPSRTHTRCPCHFQLHPVKHCRRPHMAWSSLLRLPSIDMA